MKFSENWLRTLVDFDADRATLTDRLTMSGLEVAGIEPLGESLARVVVARIVACDAHPDADKLHVCRVDTGVSTVQIVCGAPNARAGLLAPLATLGARLAHGATIQKARLRGVESFGMLCSAKELGVDADASGLLELPDDAPVGTPLAEYLGLPDAAIEIELTPNRGDCLGMRGLACEVAAELGGRLKIVEPAPVAPAISAPRGIRLEAGADCPRYLGRTVRGIDMTRPTPVWMAGRLRAAGIKLINVVVDITNYVMLETGQPMHAFDEAALEGGIAVRRARAGEVLKLLSGAEVTLDAGFLVVADARKALAVGGVMGGLDSRVTAATHDIFLEAAHFAPAAIMGRARMLALATDAAHRFERGVDPEAPRPAMERATALLREIAGGRPGEIVEGVLPEHMPQRAPVTLRRARIARVLGVAIGDAEVGRILVALGMAVMQQKDGWLVTAPTRRFDIEREEDLIEEIARIHGYHRIPASLPAGAPPAPRPGAAQPSAAALRSALVARAYREAVCYAFVDRRWLEAWQMDAGVVAVANPLSAELAVMRPSLLPGLADALRRNRNRQQARVRLFESGVVFGLPSERGSAPVETTMLAAIAAGTAHGEQWGEPSRALDFFDIKGDLAALLALSGPVDTWSFERARLPAWLHPGRGARVLRDGRPVGVIGALHPRVQQQLDLPETYLFEVREDALRVGAILRMRPLPRFPSIRRDIAIEVDETLAWARIAAAIRAGQQAIVADVVLFDEFRGPGLREGRKSLAMGLILQDESRTLTDQDADQCVAGAVALLEREFGAQLRK